MENLNLEKFSPKKAELITMVDKYKDLVIKGVDDKEGYSAVDNARKILKKAKSNIRKVGVELRADAIAFQKDVITKEKDLVSVVEPVEKDLDLKQKFIDNEKIKAKRLELLPERKEQLKTINIEVEDDFLLLMDDIKYQAFFNQRHFEFLQEKERLTEEKKEADAFALKKEQEKVEDDKRNLAEERRIEEAKKQADKEAREQAIEDAKLAKIKADEDKQNAIDKVEEDKAKAIADEKQKSKEDKDNLIKQQKEKDEQRIAEEKRAELDKAQAEAEAEDLKQANLKRQEKNKKYQNFLKKNGYTEETKQDFFLQTVGAITTLYKKIDEINIQ